MHELLRRVLPLVTERVVDESHVRIGIKLVDVVMVFISLAVARIVSTRGSMPDTFEGVVCESQGSGGVVYPLVALWLCFGLGIGLGRGLGTVGGRDYDGGDADVVGVWNS